MATGTRKPVLAGFDGSEASRAAARWAAQEASSRAAPLRLVHVVTRPFQHSIPMRVLDEREVMDKLQNAAGQELDSLAQDCKRIDAALEVDTRTPIGDVAQTLAEQASEAELVVLGGPLVGGRTDHLGAIAAEVVACRAAAPIVVVRGKADSVASGPVVVGVDGSAVSDRAVGFAFEFAARHELPLVGVHSWGDSSFNPFDVLEEWETGHDEYREKARSVVSESMAGWSEQYPDVRVQHVVGPDRPAAVLFGEANGASLLVVGSHGRGAVRRALLGSVSHEVVNQASCPVAVLPAA